jgi:hypothetical protein
MSQLYLSNQFYILVTNFFTKELNNFFLVLQKLNMINIISSRWFAFSGYLSHKYMHVFFIYLLHLNDR